jgi:hypothetical protein
MDDPKIRITNQMSTESKSTQSELETAVDSAKSQISSLLSSLESQMKSINDLLTKATEENLTQTDQVHTLKRKMSKISKDMNAKITLDIGGTLFSTTLETLVSEKDTFFTAMFSEEFNTQPDKDGHYFIDRSPLMFPYILDYLRNPLSLPDLEKIKNDKLLKRFEDEVEFYHISSIKTAKSSNGVCNSLKDLTEDVKTGSLIHHTVLDGIHRFTKTRNDWDGILMFPCKKWKIIVTDRGIKYRTTYAYGAMIGVSQDLFDATKHPNHTFPDQSCDGWFVSTLDGTLCSPDGCSKKHWGCVTLMEYDEAIFEFKNGGLEVTINEEKYGFAFKGLSSSLCPAIIMHNDASCIKLEVL